MHLVCTGMYAQAETELGPSCFFQEVDVVILLPHPHGCHVAGDFFVTGVGGWMEEVWEVFFSEA